MSIKMEIRGPSPCCLFPRKEPFVYFSGSHRNSTIALRVEILLSGCLTSNLRCTFIHEGRIYRVRYFSLAQAFPVFFSLARSLYLPLRVASPCPPTPPSLSMPVPYIDTSLVCALHPASSTRSISCPGLLPTQELKPSSLFFSSLQDTVLQLYSITNHLLSHILEFETNLHSTLSSSLHPHPSRPPSLRRDSTP